MAAWCAIIAVMRGADATSNWDKDSPPLQMAVTYFDGKECAVRCVGEADWLGPLVMKCYDGVGCDDMYLQGAQECFVSPEVVARYGCTIVKTSNTTQ